MERFFIIKGESCVDESLVTKVKDGEYLLDNGNTIVVSHEFDSTLIWYYGEYDDYLCENTFRKIGFDISIFLEV